MGTDACIDVQTSDAMEPDTPDALPEGMYLEPDYNDIPPPAHWHVGNIGRYWCPTYHNGHWPRIAGALLTLMAAPNVVAVWYYGDDSKPELMTPQRFAEYCWSYVGREP